MTAHEDGIPPPPQLNIKPTPFSFCCATALVAICLMGFFLCYWNHFVGYRAGGGQFITWSWMINHNYLPYKDFFCPAPPFYLMRGAALLSLFHDNFIAVRACGLIERTLMGVFIFAFLARLFPLQVALLPTVACVIMGSSDCADPLDVYTQEALLFSVAALLSTSKACDKNNSTKGNFLWAALAGAFCAWSLFTKQTIGFGASLSVPLAATLCLFRLEGLKRARLFFLAYSGGFLASSAFFLGYLAYHGVVWDFIQQAYISGPKAKASSPLDFLTRFVNKHIVANYYFFAAGLFLLFNFRYLIKVPSPVGKREQKEETTGESPSTEGKTEENTALATIKVAVPDHFKTEKRSLQSLLVPGLIAVSSVIIGDYLGYNWTETSTLIATLGAVLRLVGMFFTFYGCLALALYFLSKLVKGQATQTQGQVFIFAVVALADAVMVCLSFPFYEAVLTPGLALLLALLAHNLKRINTWAFYGTCFLAISGATAYKIHLPYFFEDFGELPAHQANKSLKTPQMAHFVLPANMADFLDQTTEIIQKNSKPEDYIFVYPEGSLLYALSQRRCPTFSMSHNTDTTSDALAASDAAIILKEKPKILVYYRSSENTMRTLEIRWRNGKISGNRKIMAACEELAREYKLAKSFPFPEACGDGGVVVNLYIRPW